MTKRITSPYNPARRALVEPIVQPLYSSVEIGTTPEAQKTFFQDTMGSVAGGAVYTNMENQGVLSNPKIMVVRGIRLHAAQNVTILGANIDPTVDLAKIIESYWFLLKIGEKDYLRVPAFYLSSGLGLWFNGVAAGAAAANAYATVASIGSPMHSNYLKTQRHAMTIPPTQSFRAELNKGPALASIAAARRIWCFLEGSLAREVQ